MSEEKKKKEKDRNAEEVAKIMIENMKANMADPDFLLERERRRQEALKKVLKERKEKEESEEKNLDDDSVEEP
ncbi:MAG: hypothetical protein EU517_00605 [Promethearchaeota archaeon]|nr:MAG: hypothetical protein EU517_00605 [Candidatus Lokiarchaeota archaeon]